LARVVAAALPKTDRLSESAASAGPGHPGPPRLSRPCLRTTMNATVEVTLRKTTGSSEARRLRRGGLVPAILYGHKEPCVGLVAKRDALHAVIRHGSRIVQLDGAVKTAALIRDLQWDTFGIEPLHVDFLRVTAKDLVRIKVPVELKGDSPGHRAGGIVNLVLHEIELECKADQVPERVLVSIGHLELGHALKVKDLELPGGARAVLDGEDAVVTCMLPTRKGAEEAAPVVEPEVIGRKPGGEDAKEEAGGE